jgi:hypothetical protein
MLGRLPDMKVTDRAGNTTVQTVLDGFRLK